jgi:hypothetical protein
MVCRCGCDTRHHEHSSLSLVPFRHHVQPVAQRIRRKQSPSAVWWRHEARPLLATSTARRGDTRPCPSLNRNETVDASTASIKSTHRPNAIKILQIRPTGSEKISPAHLNPPDAHRDIALGPADAQQLLQRYIYSMLHRYILHPTHVHQFHHTHNRDTAASQLAARLLLAAGAQLLIHLLDLALRATPHQPQHKTA